MPIAARAKSPTRLLVLAAVGLVATLSGCDAPSVPTMSIACRMLPTVLVPLITMIVKSLKKSRAAPTAGAAVDPR